VVLGMEGRGEYRCDHYKVAWGIFVVITVLFLIGITNMMYCVCDETA
jgi:hypothetical protein